MSCVVFVGNILTGIKVVGPFDTEGDAHDWFSDLHPDDIENTDYRIVTCEPARESGTLIAVGTEHDGIVAYFADEERAAEYQKHLDEESE